MFDLALYRGLRDRASPALRPMLEELIPIETRHAAFWNEFFAAKLHRLDLGRRLKLRALILACSLFGDVAIHLVLEAIEIYGVRKYLTIWERYRGTPLGDAVKTILQDELQHEDQVVSAAIERRVDPESIRSLFLGFNDGLVEILGAVSGFFAAFSDTVAILVASATVAVAGACSMAAGAYAADSSEREVSQLERARKAFLGESSGTAGPAPIPARSAVLVGVSYLLGSLVPVLPVALGARSMLVPLVAGAVATLLVSALLAFLSGMRLARRVAMNLALLAGAVAVTYAVGVVARTIWGVAVS
jgi:VIT1/CCC1 family predicted Fe2+/Mn2+ transporter